jgi:glutamate synthase domain-containing protein 1
MCGIIGLLARTPALQRSLGTLLVPMFHCMGERGPDSAGLAVFEEMGSPRKRKVSVRANGPRCDFEALEARIARELDAAARLRAMDNHALAIVDASAERIRAFFAQVPEVTVLAIGHAIELYKDEGSPDGVAAKYGFPERTGTHAVGHTRMATESAVSPAHAHPFTAGEDFCLVHNGSLSNPYKLRRKLEAQGIGFETDNDTEAACRFLEWRLTQGDDLETALEHAFTELDGFYTLLIGTRGSLSLVRDPVACKPAVVAETDDYVAVASEYRALAHLPGIERARIFEPLPERIYSWQP